MISRVWHGCTTPENADTYEDLLLSKVLPGIAEKNIPGYRGAHVFRRALETEVEFITVMWFDSLDNVRAFVEGDYEVAYVPPAAREVLARFDTRSQHYDVLVEPGDL
ncbi:MAG: hypothetical protein V3T24_12325 [Longimicrobiales bacterium]